MTSKEDSVGRTTAIPSSHLSTQPRPSTSRQRGRPDPDHCLDTTMHPEPHTSTPSSTPPYSPLPFSDPSSTCSPISSSAPSSPCSFSTVLAYGELVVRNEYPQLAKFRRMDLDTGDEEEAGRREEGMDGEGSEDEKRSEASRTKMNSSLETEEADGEQGKGGGTKMKMEHVKTEGGQTSAGVKEEERGRKRTTESEGVKEEQVEERIGKKVKKEVKQEEEEETGGVCVKEEQNIEIKKEGSEVKEERDDDRGVAVLLSAKTENKQHNQVESGNDEVMREESQSRRRSEEERGAREELENGGGEESSGRATVGQHANAGARERNLPRPHTVVLTYKCLKCPGKSYVSSYTLAQHMLRQHLENAHVCLECRMTFVSRLEMKSHMSVHVMKSYPCTVCVSQSLCKHLTKRRDQEGQTSENHKRTVNIYICTKCKRDYKRKSQAITHMMSAHTVSELSVCCCRKSYLWENTLMKHVRKHREFTCLRCDRKFATKEETRSHHGTTHPSEAVHIIPGDLLVSWRSPLVCPHCIRLFQSASKLFRHHQSFHRGLRPHPCPHCHRRFITHTGMKVHLRWTHARPELPRRHS